MESLAKFVLSFAAMTIVLSTVVFGSIGYGISRYFDLHKLGFMIGFGVLGAIVGIVILKFVFRR